MNDSLKSEIRKLIKEELELFKQELNLTNSHEINNLNNYLQYELNKENKKIENEFHLKFKELKEEKHQEYSDLIYNLEAFQEKKEELYTDIIESGFFNIKNKDIIVLIDFKLDNMYNRTVNLINIINKFINNNNTVTILSKYICSSVFFENIDDNCKFLNLNFNKDISFLKYDLILSMSKYSMLDLIEKDYLYKTIIFEFNNCLQEIQNLNDEYCLFILKDIKLKKYYIKNNINPDKILIQPILLGDFNFNVEKNNTIIKLIYAGTINESIISVIEEFNVLKKYRPQFSLTIIYGKIDGSKKFKRDISKIIKHDRSINFKKNINYKETCNEIAKSHIGLLLNNEINSRKLKEYKKYNLHICYGKVSILCLVNNQEDILNLKKNIMRQNYPFIEPIILINDNNLEVSNFSDYYKVLRYNNEYQGSILNKSLNNICKNTKYISKFDSKDIYCENYLSEQINALINNNCDLVGKSTQYWWFKNTDTLLKYNINNDSMFNSSILSNSITFNVDIIKEKNILFSNTNYLEVDYFINECKKNNLKIYSTSFDNLFCVKQNLKEKYNKIFHEQKNEKVKELSVYLNLFNYLCNKQDNTRIINTDEKKYISLSKISDIEFTSNALKNDYMKVLLSKDWRCSIPVGIKASIDKCYEIEISNKTILNPLEYLTNPTFKTLVESKKSNYKFSIIICFFFKKQNLLKLFLNSLESLVNQSFDDYEIIIVNDYVDEIFNTEIVNFINNYDNITYLINSFNYGVYVSKNIALSVLKGKIICFCDSDDSYELNRLEEYNKIYEEPDIYFTYESYKDYNGKIKYCPISLTFRKECLYDVGYFNDCRFSCDSEYMNKLFNYYSDKDFIKDELIITNINENNYYKTSNKFYYVDKQLYNVNHTNNERLTKNVEYGDIKRMQLYYNYIQLNKSHKLFKTHNMYYKPKYLHNNISYIKDKATLICVTNKSMLIDFIIKKFKKFKYNNKELIICLHDVDIDKKYKTNEYYYYSEYQNYELNDSSIKFIKFNSNNKIGNMFNFAINISNGEYLFKIDDDDYYSKDWVTNSINLHKKNNNNCVVGKSSFYVYFSELKEMRCYGWSYDEKETDWIGGFSISFHRSLTNNNNFKFLSKGEDSSFIKYSVKLGYVLYTHELNEDIIFIRKSEYNTLNDESIYNNSKIVENKEILQRLTNIVNNIKFLQD